MKTYQVYQDAITRAKLVARKTGNTIKVIRCDTGFCLEGPKAENTSQTFRDREHFPNGFKVSGDFTPLQASLLEKYGVKVLDAQLGVPEELVEEDAIELGEYIEPHEIEQLSIAWNAYQRIVNKPSIRMFSGKGGHIGGDDDEPVTHSTIVPRGHLTKRHR
jgi:uncharacterized protein YifE (UPF0438 family)